ncbi:MAG: GNAT family N-acetyltransferase [Chloroflexota bacterium]|nr:GNAT family N-acetyltransferase [Chloroflexota bacterium]
MTHKTIRDLGNGIIIRHSTPDDTEALVQFNREIHGEDEWDRKGLEDWTRDLMSGEGPTFDTSDFTVVEDTQAGEIVSTCCLISQTWAYEGIPFKVGRPELVGTKKDYRRRGLVRHQFDIIHQWSEARGELVQVITGIPYYYRQFGYAMALNLEGGRSGYEPHVPELKQGEEELFSFRLAVKADIPFLMAIYDRGCQRELISAVWDEDQWKYELAGKRQYNINRREIYIIEDLEGESVGFIGIPPVKWRESSALTVYELSPGFSWSAVTPSVVRFLWRKGEELGQEQDQPQQAFSLYLGEAHPAYDVIASRLPRIQKPYAYYIRVPDLAAFIELIAPVLEKRLANSAFANYTGDVKLNFCHDGLLMDFKDGHLANVRKLAFEELDGALADFPPLVFLHLLFGHRTLDELGQVYIDCGTRRDENKHLLDTLFPKRPSHIWPIS